jgi:uncharacterized membrane protein YeaQ/YmgE (transglycosylase-associated protein family)
LLVSNDVEQAFAASSRRISGGLGSEKANLSVRGDLRIPACEENRLGLDVNVSISGLNQNKSMLHIIWYIIVGFIVGLIARAIMPGAQHLGFILTTLLGIAGSIVGGLIGRLFSKPEPGSAFHPAGFIMSIIGAIILLFIWIKLAA